MYRLLLFDFDGTIADSLHQGLAQYNSLAQQHGFLPVCNIDAARKMKTKAFFKAHRIPLCRLPRLYREFMTLQHANMPQIRLYEGMTDVLSVLAGQYQLGILSSNTEENIRTCLQANGVDGVFDFIQGHHRIFGKHTSIRKILKSERLRREEAIYIGDEVRDAEAAHRAGIPFCAVSWGIHPPEVLLPFSPRFMASKPEDLLRFFNANDNVVKAESHKILA